MIIGICGLIGSGKDTVAQYLCDSRDYQRLSMASALKDATAVLFGWDREMLEGKTPESREEREKPDPFWAERLGIPNFSPRYALQFLGTDLFRNVLHQDTWVIATERRIVENTKKGKNIVISDIRFPNEMEMIRKYNGEIWKVSRGPNPEWYECAKNNPNDMLKLYPNVHYSEWAWVNTNFDFILYNNDTLADLYRTVEIYMQNRLPFNKF